MIDIKEDQLLWFIFFFDKKSTGSGIVNNNNNDNNNNEVKQNIQLAEELHKSIIRKFEKRKVFSEFRDNIWGVDLADMQLISKFNKGFRFLLCVIDVFSKYAGVIPLKGAAIVDAFQKILKECNGRQPNKIWVDKRSEFYNNYFKKWLKDNDIEMYSIQINKYMTSISKNVYIDELDDIVDEYNNTYCRTIKIKPVNAKDNTYINFKKEVNDKDPKFKVGNHVRISKYKNIFAKGYPPNWSEEVFVIKKVKNRAKNRVKKVKKEIIGTFYEKEL